MKIIKINRYRVTKRTLTEAVAVLRAGGVVVHPSESSYGLAVDPTNPQAIKRLFQLKGRSPSNPVLLAASSFSQAERVAHLSGVLRKLARKHWPGPLTVVAPAKQKLDLTGSGRSARQIAVRVPAAIWLRALAKELNRPVTSTSANLSGQSPAYSSSGVRRVFSGRKQKPDLLLDAGELSNRPPSTVIKQHGQQIRVLRQGSVKI